MAYINERFALNNNIDEQASRTNKTIAGLLIGAGVVLILVFVGLGTIGSSENNGDTKIQIPVQTEQEDNKQEKVSLTGTGMKSTDKVQLVNGLRKVTLTHDGKSNFIVTMLDKNGDQSQSFVNEIGAFNGSTSFKAEDGEYIFNVEADGNWSITVE